MTLLALTDAIRAQLAQQLTPAVPELQVTGQANYNPTPPAIDLYPADPFQEQDAYKSSSRVAFWTVRARVSKADSDNGQTLLLQLMDAAGAKSVTAALTADPRFGGACQDSTVEGPSGYVEYVDPGGQGGDLVGCQWRLQTIL